MQSVNWLIEDINGVFLQSLDELTNKAVPKAIQLNRDLELDEALSECQLLFL